MKRFLSLLITFAFLNSCDLSKKETTPAFHQPDWNSRTLKANGNTDSMKKMQTYLPVYAQIYQVSQERRVNMTATISLRNTDTNDTLFVEQINYYNTEGKLIRKYIDKTVFVKPMETVEIIINSADNEGGTGANFIFDWYTKKETAHPLFESVMVSTEGQQGISFSARGVDTERK